MYRLLFADDESLVRRNIAQMAPWEELGFTFLGSCANGHELLEMVEAEQPDIVITDINMPFISGMEAAKQIREDYPGIQIAFLTGYSDFQYAQQAVAVKAIKYILKPIHPQAFLQDLQEIKRIMDRERALFSNDAKLEKMREENKALMVNLFLHQLLLSGLEQEEARRRSETLGIDWLMGEEYCTAVLLDDPEKPSRKEKALPEDIEKVAMLNIAQEYMRQFEIGAAALVESYIVLIFRRRSGTPEEFQTTVLQCTKDIRTAIADHLWFTVSAGIGQTYPNLSGIAYSYAEAVSALGYRKTLGWNQVIEIGDILPHRSQPIVLKDRNVNRLQEAVIFGNQEEVREAVALFFTALDLTNLEAVRVYILGVLLAFLKKAYHMGIQIWQVIPKVDLWPVMETTDTQQLQESVIHVCEGLSRIIAEKQEQEYSAMVVKAIQYIENNYSVADLRADTVSQYLHLSPSYFRSVFKKEVGMPFGSYLTKLRMDKAKLLLETTELRVYEITEAIGFSNPHYFSYCFKQHYNRTPNEMRGNSKPSSGFRG